MSSNAVHPAFTEYVNNSLVVLSYCDIFAFGTFTFKYTYASFLPVFFTCGSFVTVCFAVIFSAKSFIPLLFSSAKLSHCGSNKLMLTLPTVNVFIFESVAVKYAVIPLIINTVAIITATIAIIVIAFFDVDFLL